MIFVGFRAAPFGRETELAMEGKGRKGREVGKRCAGCCDDGCEPSRGRFAASRGRGCVRVGGAQASGEETCGREVAGLNGDETMVAACEDWVRNRRR